LTSATMDAVFTYGIDFAQAFPGILWEWWENGVAFP
jgi:hypothetical protein